MKHSTSLRRHGTRAPNPDAVVGLRPDHPAALNGVTLFPSTVVGSAQAPRLLVSGHNNPKLGKEVTKGDRKGWRIFHVTLEERATCPRTCEQWLTCFGNAMPKARRHRADAGFLPLLRAEVGAVAAANPDGFIVRLHALGDFFSVEYVLAWAELLALHPALHVFGYTARRVDDPDPESAKIAKALQVLTNARWDRFAIRTSASDPVARSRSTVVMEDPDRDDVIVCPAMTGKTEACATCGLCWAPAARDTTIAFLLHGMVRDRGPRQPRAGGDGEPAGPAGADAARREEAAQAAPVAGEVVPFRQKAERRGGPRNVSPDFQASQDRAVMEALRKLAGAGHEVEATLATIAATADVPRGSMTAVIRRLLGQGQIAHVPMRDGNPARYILPPDEGSATEVLARPAPVAPVSPPARPERTPRAGKKPVEPKAASGPAPARVEHQDEKAHIPAAAKAPAVGPDAAPRRGLAVRPSAPIDDTTFALPAAAKDPGAPITLLTLGVGDCHFPLGNPDPVQRYCGKRTGDGLTYCPKHLRAMYLGGAK